MAINPDLQVQKIIERVSKKLDGPRFDKQALLDAFRAELREQMENLDDAEVIQRILDNLTIDDEFELAMRNALGIPNEIPVPPDVRPDTQTADELDEGEILEKIIRRINGVTVSDIDKNSASSRELSTNSTSERRQVFRNESGLIISPADEETKWPLDILNQDEFYTKPEFENAVNIDFEEFSDLISPSDARIAELQKILRNRESELADRDSELEALRNALDTSNETNSALQQSIVLSDQAIDALEDTLEGLQNVNVFEGEFVKSPISNAVWFIDDDNSIGLVKRIIPNIGYLFLMMQQRKIDPDDEDSIRIIEDDDVRFIQTGRPVSLNEVIPDTSKWKARAALQQGWFVPETFEPRYGIGTSDNDVIATLGWMWHLRVESEAWQGANADILTDDNNVSTLAPLIEAALFQLSEQRGGN